MMGLRRLAAIDVSAEHPCGSVDTRWVTLDGPASAATLAALKRVKQTGGTDDDAR
jgi:hypothetical protein